MTRKGYVRRCDLVRTEEIPLLQLGLGPEGGAFLPPNDPSSGSSGNSGSGSGGGGRDSPRCAASLSEGAAAAGGGPGSSPAAGPSSSSSSPAASPRALFDPKVLDLNATTLLRFIKENCRAEGSTYLLHREEGGKSVSLFDITALSSQRQRRWTWLLAMLSFRFAMRIYQQAPLFGRKRHQQLMMRCVCGCLCRRVLD